MPACPPATCHLLLLFSTQPRLPLMPCAGRLQGMSPLKALQLLLSGVAALSDTVFELPVAIVGAGPLPTRPWGLAQVSACIDALWPSHPAAREARRQLESHYWVPTFRCSPAMLSAAAAEPAAATPAARALQEVLRQHLPGTSLADLRQAALTLRAAWCMRYDAIPEQHVQQQQLLCDLQELLAGSPARVGSTVVTWAAKLLVRAQIWSGPLDGRLQQQLFADGVQRSQDAKRAHCGGVGRVGRRSAGAFRAARALAIRAEG